MISTDAKCIKVHHHSGSSTTSPEVTIAYRAIDKITTKEEVRDPRF